MRNSCCTTFFTNTHHNLPTVLATTLILTLERATYNWPLEKHYMGKNNSAMSRVWPCALMIAIANANLT